MRRSNPPAAAERGVSLLETLIALAIFALALGQVAASVRSNAAPSVAAAAADIATIIEAAGRSARLDGRARVVRASASGVTVFRGAEIEGLHQLGAGLRLTASQPIRLDADGGATGGVILLTDEDRTYAIRVFRFDGATRVERHAQR